MDAFDCPYCGQEKSHENAFDDFCSCRFCGFKSSIVHADDGKMLVVDRRMPYLQRRCRELSRQMPDVTIIIDRRIGQDPYEESDRRIGAEARA